MPAPTASPGPTHDYLGLNIGEDFEKRIVVKINAVERLRAELRSSKWSGEHIAMGTNTDPYQHAEGKYHLTRGIIEVLSEARNPFSILTKSTLILRDSAAVARGGGSHRRGRQLLRRLPRPLGMAADRTGHATPDQRLAALRRLTEAGVSCGVLVAPVLPGLSDSDDQLRSVVEAAADAGAVSITGVALHLRGSVREHYLAWIDRVRPDLAALHRERFGAGAYQPQAERDRIAEVVRATSLRCGVTGRATYAPVTPAAACRAGDAGDAGDDCARRTTVAALIGFRCSQEHAHGPHRARRVPVPARGGVVIVAG